MNLLLKDIVVENVAEKIKFGMQDIIYMIYDKYEKIYKRI